MGSTKVKISIPGAKKLNIEDILKKKDETIESANKIWKDDHHDQYRNISVRTQGVLYSCYKDKNEKEFLFPMPEVVQAGLIYFLKLDVEQKIRFLIENNISTTKIGEFKEITDFDEMIRIYLAAKMEISKDVLDKIKKREDLIDIALKDNK